MSRLFSSLSLLTSRPCAQIDVCCFDKTGTLTSDEMVLQGVLPPQGGELEPKGSHAARRVMAACQSLIHVEGKLVGDPLETTVFHACGGPSIPRSSDLVEAGMCAQSGPARLVTSDCQPIIDAEGMLAGDHLNHCLPCLQRAPLCVHTCSCCSTPCMSWQDAHKQARMSWQPDGQHRSLAAGWTQADGQIKSPKEGEREIVTILRRFHFSSGLKRMACIVKVRRGPVVIRGWGFTSCIPQLAIPFGQAVWCQQLSCHSQACLAAKDAMHPG